MGATFGVFEGDGGGDVDVCAEGGGHFEICVWSVMGEVDGQGRVLEMGTIALQFDEKVQDIEEKKTFKLQK